MTLKHASTWLGLRTIGRLSDGIRLGLETGFDSGTIVDYVYRNQAHGRTPLGVLADRVFLNHPVWHGVRARRELLIRRLLAVLDQHDVLYDVAAGPGSYLFDLPRGRYFAGDYFAGEVDRGRARARREGRDDITFVQADAFDHATWPIQHIDVLVASGFFDILVEDERVLELLNAGSATTDRGSRWVYTVMERHTDAALLQRTMRDLHGQPWRVTLRSAEQIASMATAFGWRLERIDREPHGFFAVGTLVRT
jgi:Putative methyltransferase